MFIKNFIIIFFIILIIFIIIDKYLKNTDKNKLSIKNKNYDNAILIFHQGWTDIFNSLSLINYYHNKYSKLYVIIRKDAIEIIKFYIKDLNNVELIIIDNKKFISGRFINDYELCNYIILNNPTISNSSDYLFHGLCDIHRDKYKNSFIKNSILDYSKFVNNYYEVYDIPISTRIDYFIFSRDYKLENLKYNNFIKDNGEKYILYHSNDNNIDFIKNKKNEKYINLNKKSNIFFDYIKILENSIEIHLIDSSWAVFIYLLDAKYRLFKNKKIYLYPTRGYSKMFKEPIQLDNWIFVKQNFFNIFINLLNESLITDLPKYYINQIFNS